MMTSLKSGSIHPFPDTRTVCILLTVAAPIKDAAFIQKIIFELRYYDAFYPKSFRL